MPDKPQARNLAATSAYDRDGRTDSWPAPATAGSGWHPTLDNLLAGGHIFMNSRFGGKGVLFRGMPSGFKAAWAGDSFWHSDFDNSLCRLEKSLGVIFCSELARDAMAVARPWDNGREDAAILVFASDGFERRWQQRAAAVLGFADMGLVFKYPCIAEPLRRDDLLAVVSSAATRDAALAAADASAAWLTPGQADSRDAWQSVLDNWMRDRGHAAASAAITDSYPRRG